MDYTAPEGTIKVLEAIFYLCAAGLCMAGMFHILRGKSPEPPNRQLEATINELRDGLQEVKDDNSKLWAAIDSNLKLTETANEKRAHDIHVRLNPAAEDIAEVKGQMQAFTTAFENFTEIIVAISTGKKP